MKSKNILIVMFSIIIICCFTYVVLFGFSINGKTYIEGAKGIKTGLDISGGVSITYQAKNDNSEITAEDLKKSETVIRKRLENINIYDFFVRMDDSNKRIYLEIPADINDTSKDPLEAVKGLDKTAKIEFTDPDGKVVLSGDDIKSAKYSEDPIDQSGIRDPHVVLEFSNDGRKKFADATEKLVGKPLSINLDGKTITAPIVNGKIDQPTAIITLGNDKFSVKKTQATEYAMLIDSGALPFTLEVINKEYIGPYVGQKALEISKVAGVVAFIFIAIFMIVIYRLPGVVSAISLTAYISIVLFIMLITKTSLTLASIAGIILSIGMAVDANVIIFERLKEELKLSGGYKKAFERSFKHAMAAIIDGNTTTFIIAILLYIFGIGPIKGFGLILAIGVLVSVLTAVVITKTILKQLLPLSNKVPFLFSIKKEEI
ncbi:MAG: protein translocase subunit SecD [Clostridia bacterium]